MNFRQRAVSMRISNTPNKEFRVRLQSEGGRKRQISNTASKQPNSLKIPLLDKPASRKSADKQHHNVSGELADSIISKSEACDDEDFSDTLPWQVLNESTFTLAITGRAFSKIIDESAKSEKHTALAITMLLKTQIFARMKPDEKALLLLKL